MRKLLLLFTLLPLTVMAHAKDVVYLKNGSIIKGNIKELNPTESLKIETSDGNIFVYNLIDVERITKEDTRNKNSLSYKGFGDITFGGTIENIFNFDISTTHGIFLSDFFFLGGGVEFDLNYCQREGFITDYEGNIIGKYNYYLYKLPIYIDFRIYPSKKTNTIITPFLDFRIGGEVLSYYRGLFLSPSAGVRFNLEKIALNTAFCYEFYNPAKKYYSSLHDLGIKIGIEF